MTNKAKLTLLLVCVFLVGIFVASLVASLKSRTYGTLETLIVPNDAVVLLNGKKIRANREIGVTPGTYTLSVSRSGFESAQKTVTIKKGALTETGVVLKVNSDEGRKWLDDHPDQIAEADGYHSRAFDADVDAAVERLPLISYLPLVNLQYRIDYGRSQAHPDDPNATAIYVKYWSEEGRAAAVEWIRSKGFDPDKLEIIYAPGSKVF